MTQYARIGDNGRVMEVVPWNPEGFYPPSMVWKSIDDDIAQSAVSEKMRWNGEGYSFPPPPYEYFLQSDVWNRGTDDECEQIMAALKDSKAKVQGLWSDSRQVLIMTEDPDPERRGTDKDRSTLYSAVRSMCLSLFTEGRTDELLAPSGVIEE